MILSSIGTNKTSNSQSIMHKVVKYLFKQLNALHRFWVEGTIFNKNKIEKGFFEYHPICNYVYH